MKDAESFGRPSPKKLDGIKRRAIQTTSESLVKTGLLESGNPLPLVIQPAVEGVDLMSWGTSNREWIETQLLKHGGILFRNFNVHTAEEFEQLVSALSGDLLEYRERSSPRSQVSGNIYTSTEHPAHQSIFPHNENSYQHAWPLRIFFFCLTPAEQGGETPIADVRKVYERIDPDIRERFIQKKIMYVRNYTEGLGLSWQTVFQTTDKNAVDAYCRNAGIISEWKDDQHLRTRSIREAIVKHPQTGEMLWFNHAAFFHVSTLEPSIRETLEAQFKADELPTNTFYGDGSPIEPDALEAIREAYYQELVYFPWQKTDVLMLDNMLVAHGRAPFAGPRKVLVGMAKPISL